MLPSVVAYLDSEKVLVGESARRGAAQDPLNTLSSIKRLMGRGQQDLSLDHLPYEFTDAQQGMVRIRTRRGDVSPVEVSARSGRSGQGRRRLLQDLRSNFELTLCNGKVCLRLIKVVRIQLIDRRFQRTQSTLQSRESGLIFR